MAEPLKISNSEIQTFKACKRKWYLSYYRGLKVPEKATGALALGTRVHEALASYYAPNGTKGLALGVFQSGIEEDRTKVDAGTLAVLEKEGKLGRIMLDGYFEYVEEEGVDSGLEIIEAESEIDHILDVQGTTIRLVGKRDATGIDSYGRKFFLDHKTCQSLTDTLLDLNEQLLMYALLAKLTRPEEQVEYAVWNLLRKVQRTAKAIPPFYAREQIEVSEFLLRNFFTRTMGTISDIIAIRHRLDEGVDHRVQCYPTPSRMCSWGCDFRVACPMLDMDKYAEEFILATYTKGNPYERYSEQRQNDTDIR